MSIPLKLGIIEQQHLQELYEAAGVPREELPYTPEFAQLCRDFQDRTFRNAGEAQVYEAIIKYVRSSRCTAQHPAVDPQVAATRARQAAAFKAKHPTSVPKLKAYSREFEAARISFSRDGNGGVDVSSYEFWKVAQLATRRTTTARPRAARKAGEVAIASAP